MRRNVERAPRGARQTQPGAASTSNPGSLPALPAVPTFTEAGLPGFDVKGWYAVFAPAGIPKAAIGKLSAEFAKILAMPDIREKIASQGMESFISAPEVFAALVKADHAKWGKVIKTANIKLE